MKKAFAILCMLASSCVFGQSYTAVTATSVQVDNGSGGAVNPPSGSDLCFLGVNNVGAAITYTPAGGGPVTGAVCQTMDASGNLTGSFQVANPATASPIGLLYTITVVKGSTTYLTIPQVSVSGALFQFSNFTLPVNGMALGIGYPHLSCNQGATWASTTLPPASAARTCQLVSGVGTWVGYPQAPYCPAGTSYQTPQISGSPFCLAPISSGVGAPTGTCIGTSVYFQIDAPGTIYGCYSGGWTMISGSGGAGITSFQGRTTPAATLQSSDVQGILQNGPFGLTGTQGLLYDLSNGVGTPSADWKLGTGATAGQLFGYKDLNLAPNSSTASTVNINAATGAATLANGNFTVSASGVAAMAASSTVNGSLICTPANGACPPTGTAYYQFAQNAATSLTQRSKMNFITSSGISGADNSGNASTDVSLSNIPNASLANSSVTVNVTGSATGGGTISLGGSTTINVASGGAPAGTTGAVQYNNSGVLGGINGTGYVQANGASAPTIVSTIPSSSITYPTAIQNQVWQYTTPSAVGPGGFLSQIDLVNCSTAFLYNEGSGTVTHNLCATGSSRNGTVIGSPAWSQYGLVLNPQTFGQSVQLTSADNLDKTFLIAGYFPNWGTSLGVNWGGNTSFPSNGGLLCGTTADMLCLISWDITQNAGITTSSLFSYRPVGAVAAAGIPIQTAMNHVIGIICNTGSGASQYYYDGVPVSMAASPANCPTSPTGLYQIGGSNLLTGSYQSFILSASMTFTAAISNTTMAAQSNALLNYVNSRGQTNPFSPAISSGGVPSVVCVGDSRTVGITGPSPCTYIVLDDTTAVITISANAGEKAYNLCASGSNFPDANTTSLLRVAKTASKMVAIVWIDVNDMVSGTGVSFPNAVAANDACIVKNLKALGATVLFATEISAESSIGSTGDTGKNEINPFIMNYAKQWGADGIVNLNSFPIIGADGASSNGTYFAVPPGLHPSIVTNQTILAIAYQNAVNELWGSTANSYNVTASTSYQELAKDGYLRLTGASAQTITLPDCQGYNRPRTIYNASGFTATVLPHASGFYVTFTEAIDGNSSTTIPNGHTAVYGIINGPSSTGTCTWQTLQ